MGQAKNRTTSCGKLKLTLAMTAGYEFSNLKVFLGKILVKWHGSAYPIFDCPRF
jgi:hypothetical protein